MMIPNLDLAAVVIFIASWAGYGYLADASRFSDNNLLHVVNRYRKRWMHQMLKRENRLLDANLIGNLLRSISFLASTSILILFTLMTLFGNKDKVMEVLAMIPFADPASGLLWDAKIFLLAVIFVYSFFKFTWSLRQYNYACVMVGSAPLKDEMLQHHDSFAEAAGQLIANASRHFNLGMRSYYFGLAALSWMLHPWILILATMLVVAVLYRREFRSKTLKAIIHQGALENS